MAVLVHLAAWFPLVFLSGPPARQDSEFAHGSGIEIEELSPVQVENLATLGKVWGFLKYHHPLITGGEVVWDPELFRVLPQVLDAPDRERGSAALLDWVRGIGEPEPCDPCAEALADAHLQPELDWIADGERLGAELSGFLGRVHRNRSVAEAHRQVSFTPGVGNPIFKDEAAYAHLREPDAGYRLLALFRFWNVVEYWFPYRDVIGEDWDDVLAEFVPRLATARSRDDYCLQFIALIARANDTHANLWGSLDVRPPRGEDLLPVELRFVEGRALVARLLGPSELRVGDVLLEVEGQPVESLVAAWSPFFAASNEAARLRDIARVLTQGGPGTARVRLERGGQELELVQERVSRDSVEMLKGATHDLPGETFRLLSPDVAYLKLSSVHAGQVPEQVRAAQGTRGLVIDIRNYPSEFVVFALGQCLVREPTPFARFTCGSAANPGAFSWTEPLVLEPVEPHYDGRVVILVDETSQSQSEYTAMAFRAAPDALVVGSTTAGADGNVSPLALPGGLRTMISGIGVFYPDKSPTQRVGILPDIEVRPTIAGLRAGRDEVLEAALRAILGPETPEEELRRIASEALAAGR